MLALLFVASTYTAGYYYFFLVLIFANLLNVIWGEFTNREIREELYAYYATRLARHIKYINAVVLLGVLIWATVFVATQLLSTAYLVGFTLAMGVITGCFSLTLAHDLLHGQKPAERFLSNALIVAAGIPHFATDHISGHHRLIGLQYDATTAPLGKSFYRYFLHVSWQRIRNSFGTGYGLHHYMRIKIVRSNFRLLACLIAIWAFIAIASAHPVQALVFFVAQGFIAYVLYELINYIQHYGLRRQAYADGSAGKIQMEHSWNCYYKYTNYILHLLPLHSVHHLHHADRKHISNYMGPRMPYLYFVMIGMALVPPLWFRVMDPLARQYQYSRKNVWAHAA